MESLEVGDCVRISNDEGVKEKFRGQVGILLYIINERESKNKDNVIIQIPNILKSNMSILKPLTHEYINIDESKRELERELMSHIDSYYGHSKFLQKIDKNEFLIEAV